MEIPQQFVDDYVRTCENQIDRFVEKHFSWRGTLDLHRAAIGADLVKAPAKLFLAIPLLLAPVLSIRIKWFRQHVHPMVERISSRLETGVDKRVKQLIRDELLFHEDGGRMILQVLQTEDGPRKTVERFVESYSASRAAMAEITTVAIYGLAGGVIVHQFTPTAISLGPSLAAMEAQRIAVQAFPLGETLGGLWYQMFPVASSTFMVVATTVCLLVAMSVVAAFAGILADPVQRIFRLHHYRLRRLIRATGAALADAGGKGYSDPIRLLPRLIDLIEAGLIGLKRLSH